MSSSSTASTRPQIRMIEEEAEKLSDLALSVEARSPQVCELLLQEISRARMYSSASIPVDVVTMGSFVDFVDEGSGANRSVQLVYPPDADISKGRISILTPVGAGLIGLREGQSIRWPDREGHQRTLVIVRVKQSVDRAA